MAERIVDFEKERAQILEKQREIMRHRVFNELKTLRGAEFANFYKDAVYKSVVQNADLPAPLQGLLGGLIGKLREEYAAPYHEIFNRYQVQNTRDIAQQRIESTLGRPLTEDEKSLIEKSPIDEISPTSELVIKNARERDVQEALNQLPGEEEAAIGDLDKALQMSQADFFTRQLQPQIERSLASRGLLRSGNLPVAFAEAGRNLQTAREQTIAPLRAQTRLGGLSRNFENVMRGALDSGRSLSEATNFARSLMSQGRQNEFSASQAELGRRFKDELARQQMAFALANQPRQREPSGWDYFLQYGLPVIGQITGAGLSGFLSRKK